MFVLKFTKYQKTNNIPIGSMYFPTAINCSARLSRIAIFFVTIEGKIFKIDAIDTAHTYTIKPNFTPNGIANSKIMFRNTLSHKYIVILLTAVNTASKITGKHKEIDDILRILKIGTAPTHCSPYKNNKISSAHINMIPEK